ncbi:replication initiation negative regulator SeqA [Candidatus Sodalis endolongispinus]|uniref:Negative modulator of initiation of replication n=1 Tax=Candidatus Sodalis endolongispinus TaxID=2812662 RepID=A0ABS5Y9J7_9GAMM|nr:replication initiation negative regulator SeqA [Candidatus Sodalis endolongispinus]MBT9431339.1 replication initiation negative regulator SeqA [Candidatus Sodalis endolongispinus]
MKTIEVDEDLYRYIAGHTLHIGESASDILRRLLKFSPGVDKAASPAPAVTTTAKPSEKSESVRPLPERVRAMRELLLSDDYALQRKVVDRFMLVLTTLHTLSPQAFAEATETLHGRTRTYFAVDRQTLLQSGHQTKPKQVPGTPYWVITNTNSDRKRSMIEHIMLAMQFPTELIEKVCGTLKFH